MYSRTSRSEHLEVELYRSAEQGLLSQNKIKKIDSRVEERITLYPREIRRLERNGFLVIIDGMFDSEKKLYYVTISWCNPFNHDTPYSVKKYIDKTIDTFPQEYVKNLAQKLYVIAHRADNKK